MRGGGVRNDKGVEREEGGKRRGDGRWYVIFFFSSRRRHTRLRRDWSSDVCSSDLLPQGNAETISPPQDMNRSKLNLL